MKILYTIWFIDKYNVKIKGETADSIALESLESHRITQNQ
jgi:hypothetical protein